MSDIEIIKNKHSAPTARIKRSGLPDIPRPYTIIFKTTVPGEFEEVALTQEQYEKILTEIEKGASGIILNGEYYDKWDIKRIKNQDDY